MRIGKETYEEEAARRRREHDEHVRIAEVEAQSMVVSVLAEQPDRFAKFQAEHEKDKTLYQFRCERYGDFLALFITRGEPPEPSRYTWYQPPSNKLCATLNLGKTRKMDLTEGLPADCQGTVTFRMHNEHKDGKWVPITKADPPLAPFRPILVMQEAAQVQHQWEMRNYGGGGGGDTTRLQFSVPHAARAATDDKIYFHGAGATLFIPQGSGEEIYRRILAAVSVTA